MFVNVIRNKVYCANVVRNLKITSKFVNEKQNL